MNTKMAVLLLAYGGPNSLDDIPAYLLDIRGGRHTPQHLIDEITDRYKQIGGRSPLLDITRSTAARLQEATGLPVYVGMRHWYPFVKDTVAQMVKDGIEHTIAICMAPHYSTMSIGAYRKKFEEALASLDTTLTYDFIESWGTQPDYLAGITANARAALERFSEQERPAVKIVYTAHSLPEMILERGDPYDAQLRETATLLAEQMALQPEQWTFSYQSAAQTGIPWLGPQIEDLVADLAASGHRSLLIVPIGFIADHVEVLYDIDIGVQAIARTLNMHVERPPMLNDTPPLVNALTALVNGAVSEKA